MLYVFLRISSPLHLVSFFLGFRHIVPAICCFYNSVFGKIRWMLYVFLRISFSVACGFFFSRLSAHCSSNLLLSQQCICEGTLNALCVSSHIILRCIWFFFF